MNAEEDGGIGVSQASTEAKSPARAIMDAPEWLNDLSGAVIGCAMEVHSQLGPGLLERIYEQALAYELTESGLSVKRQSPIVVKYKHIEIGGQRLDLVVNDTIVVELKAVDAVSNAHLAQLVSYLRAARMPLGLVINFNELRLKDGIYRRMNAQALAHWDRSSSATQSQRTVRSPQSATR